MEEVRSEFRPEFLNRLDEIVIFHPLSDENLTQILDLLLGKESKLADGARPETRIHSQGQKVDAGAERSPGMGRASAAADHPAQRARAVGGLSAEGKSAVRDHRQDRRGQNRADV